MVRRKEREGEQKRGGSESGAGVGGEREERGSGSEIGSERGCGGRRDRATTPEKTGTSYISLRQTTPGHCAEAAVRAGEVVARERQMRRGRAAVPERLSSAE